MQYIFKPTAVPLLKFILLLFSLLIELISCKGQKTFGEQQLLAKQNIFLPAVEGRIDHMDVNLKQQMLYVAALGNNSLEIVDLKTGKRIHSIQTLDEPQGVAYISQTNEIFVANGGNGNCYFFNANSFDKLASDSLGSDADDVRYDSSDKKIYVGYGDGGIAVIDAMNHQKIAEIPLAAHPEGFQLDKALNKLFVNVPDAGLTVVIDLKTRKIIGKWKANYNANFPMAIDLSHHILFIGYRHPNKLVAIDANTGKIISETELVADVDDLFFDEHTRKIYASGGGGFINIFSFENLQLKKIANVETRSGARTSFLIASLKMFIVAERAGAGRKAELNVYSIQ